ncbi:MAG: hypothetical protein ACYS8W_16125 [Planctomycetota bacterium]
MERELETGPQTMERFDKQEKSEKETPPEPRKEKYIIDNTCPQLTKVTFTVKDSEAKTLTGSVIISWKYYDGHPHKRPITIEYSEDGGYSWRAVAKDLPDNGSYEWKPEKKDIKRKFLRIRVNAIDLAGNQITIYARGAAADKGFERSTENRVQGTEKEKK